MGHRPRGAFSKAVTGGRARTFCLNTQEFLPPGRPYLTSPRAESHLRSGPGTRYWSVRRPATKEKKPAAESSGPEYSIMNCQPTLRRSLAPIAGRASSVPSIGVAPVRAAGTRTSIRKSSLEATSLIRKCAALSLFVLLSVSSVLAKEKPSFVESELLVRFDERTSPSDRAAAIASVKGKAAREYSRIVPGLVHVKLDKGALPDAAIAALQHRPGVLYAERNLVYDIGAVPDDPSFPTLYGLDNTGQDGGTVDADIDAPEAWEVTTGSPGVVVGVIDTGIDYNHEDLRDNMWVNPLEIPGNGVDDDVNGYVDDVYGINAITSTGDPFDDHRHGTHVAGTIGARANNGIGVAGVNWNVRLMALKFLSAGGSGTTADAIECINYAVSLRQRGVNIRVLSNSWGGGGFSQALLDAINAADGAGMLFVAAAGNSGVNADTYPHYPSSYDAPNLVSVASTTNTDGMSSFSNYGAASVDLGAPGSSILSTTPNNTYSSFSGTSMATPHVSGVAALLLAANDTLTVDALKKVLLDGTDPIASLQGKCVSGGRLNASRALDLIGTPQPNFDLSSTPRLQTVIPGENATYTIPTTTVGGFAGEITLSASSSPVLNATIDFTSNPVAAGDSSTMTVTTSAATAPGSYLLTITGASGPTVTTTQVILVVQPEGTITSSYDVSPGTAIPDNDSNGITSTIDIESGQTIAALALEVDITHAWIGDLEVTLISPQGTSVIVHNRAGGSADNIHQRFNLPDFNSQSSFGVWTLKVLDLASPDAGTLDHWGLDVTGVPTGSNTAPAVSIQSPASGSSNLFGAIVSFNGEAADAQDGDVTTSLVWTSSIDGPIGTGGAFSTSSLSVGQHRVTATATDSNSAKHSASITITVAPRPVPSIVINDVTVVEGNSGTTDALFGVTLSVDALSTVTVDYATANGTATGGSDYVAASGTLSFAPGETVKTIIIAVIGDVLMDGTESFFVNLSNPTNATVGDSQGRGTITGDDERDMTFTTFAGHAPAAVDGRGTAARFSSPEGGAVDAAGNIYVADTGNQTIRKISASGEVTTLAGLAQTQGSVDGTGSNARFNFPVALVIGPDGNLYVADQGNYSIRRVTPSGSVTTIAGSASRGWGTEDGPVSVARFWDISDLAFDSRGNLFVADTAACTIRKISTEGIVSTFAGFAMARGSEDGIGSTARFDYPQGIAIDANDRILVADGNNRTIRAISSNGVVSTVAGLANTNGCTDATGSDARFRHPSDVAVVANGDVIVVDSGNNSIRRIQPTGQVSTLAGLACGLIPGGADGRGAIARFHAPTHVASRVDGSVVVADTLNHSIRIVSPSGEVTTIAGLPAGGSTIDGRGTEAIFDYPAGLAIGPTGDLFVADLFSSTIRRSTPEGEVSTLAGRWRELGALDGVGDSARFKEPRALALASNGDLLVADSGNARIRRVTLAGVVTSIAGSGARGSADGPALVASFMGPSGLAVDSAGNVFMSDAGNHTIRKLSTEGVVSTIAGLAGSPGEVDGVGAGARLWYPASIGIEPSGNLLVTTQGKVRRVAPSGEVTTPDAFKVGLGRMVGLSVDPDGTVWLSDDRNALWVLRPGASVATTIAAGSSIQGSVEGTSAAARFTYPRRIVGDGAGNVFIADAGNSAIRKGVVAVNGAATIDDPPGCAGQTHQLSFTGTADSYSWRISRRPVGSIAELSSATASSPTFVPDVNGLYEFQLVATTGNDRYVGYVSIVPARVYAIVQPAYEFGGGTTFGVMRTDTLTTTVTANWSLSPGTATPGADYVPSSGTLTFNPGEQVKYLTIEIVPDVIDEASETFSLVFSDVTNAMGGTSTITIVDNDPMPALTIADATIEEGNAGRKLLPFTARLSAPSGLPVTVDYATADGTATAGADYLAASGKLSFAPGETEKSVNVEVIGDVANDPTETFVVNLSNPTNAFLGDGQATGTIVNDDTPVLSATAVSASRIDLAWTFAGTGQTGFRIERKLAPSGSWMQIALVSASARSYSSLSLNACTAYAYRVRSYVGTTLGLYSNEASATTTGCLASPSDLVATPASATRINLSWNYGGTGHTGFKIERRLASASTWATIATLATPSATSYANTSGLTGCTGYVYRVRAYSGTSNYGPYSNEATATTTGCLATPSDLVATPASATRVDLSWSYSGSGHTGFKIERRFASASTWATIATLATPSATSYANASGLIGCTGYVYRVRAYSGTSNYGPYSNEAAASTTGCLATPSSLVATPASATRVDLSWSYAGTGHSGFRIERRLASASTWTPVASTTTPSTTSYANVSGLTGCTGYVYRVRAWVGTASGPYSNEATATTPGCLVTPSGLTATGVSRTQINLSWSYGGTGHSGFNIERRIRGNATWALVARTTTPATTTYASPGLVTCTEYEYRVRAYSGTTSNSPWSTETTGATIGCITAPTSLVATPQSATSVRLTWSYVGSGHTGFRIERRLATGTTWAQFAATTTPGTLTYTNSSLLACRGYVYRVRAYTSTTANSLFSNEASVTTTCP